MGYFDNSDRIWAQTERHRKEMLKRDGHITYCGINAPFRAEGEIHNKHEVQKPFEDPREPHVDTPIKKQNGSQRERFMLMMRILLLSSSEKADMGLIMALMYIMM